MPDSSHFTTLLATGLALLWLGCGQAAANTSAFEPGLSGSITAAEHPRQWRFKVMLDERTIGEHSFKVAATGDAERVDIEARFEVKFAFITAYEYDHSNIEQWQAGCLNRIDSNTDDNGKHYRISGSVQEQGFALQLNEGQQRLEQRCVNTFAYWRPSILGEQQLLNSQTGQLQDIRVRFEGFDQVNYNGRQIDSRQYVLTTADGDIKLWYTLDKQYWLALEAPARGDRVIRYVPMLLPAGAVDETANTHTFSKN